MKTFNERFSYLINQSAMNASEIANALGVSKQTISAWRTGERSPRKPMIESIADFFNVNIPWLMGYDVPMEREHDVPSSSDPELEEFIRRFLALSPENRRRILDLMRALAGSPVSPGDPPA